VAILQKIKLIGQPFYTAPFGAGTTGATDINTFSAEYATTNWGDAGAYVSCHARMGGFGAWGGHSEVRYVTCHDWVNLSARLGPDPTKAFDGAPAGPFTEWSARYYFDFNGECGDNFLDFPQWISTLDIMNGTTKLDPLVCRYNQFEFPRVNYGKLAIPGRTGFTPAQMFSGWVRCEVQFNSAFTPNMVVRLYDGDDTTPIVVWSYNTPWTAATGLALTSPDNGQDTFLIAKEVSIALLEFANTYDLDGEFPGGTAAVATTTNPSGTGTPETEQQFYVYPPDQAVRGAAGPGIVTPTLVSNWQFAASPTRIADVAVPGGEPNNADGWPVVVWCHGGYWVGGDKGLMPTAWRDTLLNAGYAVVSVGYVKSTMTTGAYPAYGTLDAGGIPGGGRYPSWIIDFKLCAARLEAASTANGWGLDTSRMIASGYSAGGYISAAAAVSEGVTNDGGGRNLTIAGNATYRDGYTGADPEFLGAYTFAPCLDLQAAADYDLNDPGLPPVLVRLFYPGTPDRGSLALTSRPFMGLPITTATDPSLDYTSVPEIVAARDAIGDVPPVACVWGSGDFLINKWSHEPQMAAAMTAAGSTYTAVDAETIHEWLMEEFQRVPMLAFLDALIIGSGGLPGVLSPVEVVVEFAFGFGPGGTPAPGDWVAVSDYVDLTSSSAGVRCSSGRTNPRQGIRPGTLEFTLDNRDGRFNPRNASGPYYGELRNGTPVRVTTNGAGDLTVGTPVAGPAGTGADALSGPALGTIDVFGAGWVENPDLDEVGTYADREVVIPVTPTLESTVVVTAVFETIAGDVGSGDNLSTSNNISVVAFEDNPATSGYSGNPILGIEFVPVGVRTVGSTTTLTLTFEAAAPCWVVLVAPLVDPSELGVQQGWKITATIDSHRSVWYGFVDSGWPQTITSRYPTVTITAQDVLGLLAQGEAPASAFDAFLKDTSPDHVWKPGPTGWIDSVTGKTMRHTGQLEQATGGESIIAGEAAPYGQEDATGYGICEDSATRLDSGADAITILTRVKFPTVDERTFNGLAESIVVIDQAEAAGNSPVRVTVGTDTIEVLAVDSDGLRQAYTTDPNPKVRLMDGAPHTIAVHIPAGSGTILVWVDGRAVEMTYSTSASAYSLVPGDVYVGYPGPAVATKRPYQGYIDPVVIWRDYVGTVATLVAEGHAAASAGWAGQRLDQRVTSIVEGMDVYDYIGTLDTSGIVTQQAYRREDPLRLLQTIEDTEQGRVWVDKYTGSLRFSGRSWAWNDTASKTVQITFSDDPTLLDAGTAQEMLEGGTIIADDPLNIVNVASVTSENGRQQTVTDAASIALFGRRNPLSLSGLLHPTDSQSRAVAEWLLLSQADPQIQARQVSFRVEDNPTVLAPIAAAIEEGWLVRIVKSTTAETLDMQAHVIGVAHDFRFTGWTVTLTLDATRTGYSFFKWGTSNWGGSAGWAF
jgi:acetyl esterase/lipase